MNAVAYLRVSGNSQLDGTGFDRQLDACTQLASNKGFTLTETFREAAISGVTEVDERPAFQSMIAYMQETHTSVIVVESLDRLAREYRVSEQLLLYIAAKGFVLYNAGTGENVTESILADPMRKAMVQIQGIFAELDKSLIVAKLRKGRQIVKSKVGRCEGRKPFGHHPDLPAETAILAEMRRLRLAGMRPHQIAEELVTRGIPSRSGAVWQGPTIAKILRREQVTAEPAQLCAFPAM